LHVHCTVHIQLYQSARSVGTFLFIPACTYSVHSSIYLHVHCTQIYLPTWTVTQFNLPAFTVYTVLYTSMYYVHSSIYMNVQCTQFYLPTCTLYNVHSSIYLHHTGLTWVRGIRFLLFEIKRVLVFYSIIICFTDLFMLYIFIQNEYANKKVFYRKG